jgi:ATP-dependent RNA helicase DeaD
MENLLFKDLKVSTEILKALEVMGFEEATPIQTESILPILDGNDVIAQAPTGTGKTCAFGIPLIEQIDINSSAIQGLILCPTRELVIQTTEELLKVAQFKKNIKVVPIYGGQQIDRQIFALKRNPQIIVATPGRMMDHLRRRTIKIDNLKQIILDEADEMLNMGFREDIDVILETVPTERQTVLFSATLSKEILDIARKFQKPNAVTIKITHKELTVPTIEQYYLEVKGPKKIDVLTRLIDTNNYKLCLVFCNTKRKVDELTDELTARGYSAEALHGDMKQIQRDRVMNRFRKGQVEILIATDVAARGIDVDDIEAVFNFDIPSDEEYYVHRIGRTGRANRKGVSYSFVAGKEMFKLKEIMRYTKATIHPFKAPSVSDVEEVKIRALFNEVDEVIKNGKLTKFVNYIEKQISEDETNELTTLDIAAALMNILFKSNAPKQTEESVIIDNEASKKTGAEPGMTRLFMNLGTLDRIRPRHIVEVIASNTNMQGSVIGAIDIFDKYSFVEVPNQYSSEVIDALNTMNYKGRKIAIEEAVASNNRNSEKNRRTRDQGSPSHKRGFVKTGKPVVFK